MQAGGFGDVWLARERVTGVFRALKVVYKADAQRAARDIEGVKRYQGCAHNHPHLLQILTVGETDECFYYVMEAADNRLSPDLDRYEPQTLRTYPGAAGHIEARAALQLLQKLLSAVTRLHEQGLAHYDLKPDNILIVQGEPKIADVGLVAPREDPPVRVGTPVYMTPSGEADDVFALGLILYELVTGRPPSDFPRLPADLLQQSTHEPAAAVQIINRACHPDPKRRFSTPAEFADAVTIALRPRRGVHATWRRMSPRARVITALTCLAVLVAAGVALRAWIPHIDYACVIPLEKDRFVLVQEAQPAPGQSLWPYLCLKGTPFDQGGTYVQALGQPVRNFLLQCRVRTNRPWGGAHVGLASDREAHHAVRAYLWGQPDGVGLRTQLDVDGVSNELPQAVFGHPQPGVEYILRLARVGDEVKLALWPLARPSLEPLETTRRLPPEGFVAHYVTLECATADPHAAIDISELSVWDRSVPFARIDHDLPADVGRVHEALVPPLPPDTPARFGDILRGDFHPYDSEAWMSVGGWSWWTGAAPGAVRKEIRCTPCSTGARRTLQHPHAEVLEGLQLLRFDRARYGNFVATLHARLRTDPHPAADDPFVAASHSGGVGLGFRLQDVPAEGSAWGGGYAFVIELGPDERTPAAATLERFGGLTIEAKHASAVTWAPTGGRLVPCPVEVPRSALLAPGGFELQVRASGQHFSVSVNGQEMLSGDDPGGFTSGRLALYASRLIATFDSLDVAPLP